LRGAGFDYFCFLSAIDWLPSPYGRGEDDPTEPPPERSTEIMQGYAGGETRFQMLARLTDTRRHVSVTIKCDVPTEDLVVEAPASFEVSRDGSQWAKPVGDSERLSELLSGGEISG
jgi:NADH-quinone oxidoreductase subunit C